MIAQKNFNMNLIILYNKLYNSGANNTTSVSMSAIVKNMIIELSIIFSSLICIIY